MDMTPDLAQMFAQFGASVTSLFNIVSGKFSQLSEMNRSRQQGWAFADSDTPVRVGGSRGVFLGTAKPEYSQRFASPMGSRG